MVDEQETVDWVAEWVEKVRLIFLRGQAYVFTAFPVAFLLSVALFKMVNDLVDPVSDNSSTMVRSFDNIPLLTLSNL